MWASSASLDAACAIPLCAISGALPGGARVDYVVAVAAFSNWTVELAPAMAR